MSIEEATRIPAFEGMGFGRPSRLQGGRTFGTLRFPAYGNIEMVYLRTDDFGGSILWVRDAHVYMHLGAPSLSFVFPNATDRRHTVRIGVCENVAMPGGGVSTFYMGEFNIEKADVQTQLSIWIADHPVIQTGLILCTTDAERLRDGLDH